MPKPCYLRQTKVKLLDGVERSFRALPFSRKTVQLLGDLLEGTSDVARIKALHEAIELALGYDQTPAEVEAIFDAGLIPLMPGGEGSEEARIHGEIMGALVLQAGK